MTIHPALYDLAGARSRARRAHRLLYADGWTIGDPLACYLVAVRDIRRARRALRAAGITPPPVRGRSWRMRQPCGSVAHVLTLSTIAPVTCERHADHEGSHCARLPGVWQWWNRDDAPPPVEIPMAAYVNGGRPRDWLDPRQTR